MNANQIDRVTVNHETGVAKITHIDPNGVEHTQTISVERLRAIYNEP